MIKNKLLANVKLKRCSTCQKILHLCDFHKDAHRKTDGLSNKCKGCVHIYSMENKVKKGETARKWAKDNREKVLAYQKDYYRQKKSEKANKVVCECNSDPCYCGIYKDVK